MTEDRWPLWKTGLFVLIVNIVAWAAAIYTIINIL